MKIAVTYDNGEIFQHFGHTKQFKIYQIEKGEIKSSRVMDTNGSGHGELAELLNGEGVGVLICGGIGGGAISALEQMGIMFFGGVSGNADEAVKALLTNSLQYDPNVKCDHHDGEHGDTPHTCGSHGCGSHGCRHGGCH